jgi:hypothetical protein
MLIKTARNAGLISRRLARIRIVSQSIVPKFAGQGAAVLRNAANAKRTSAHGINTAMYRAAMKHTGYMPVNVFKSGKDHPNWIADRSQVNRRWWPENKVWRLAVLKRDKYQCQMCSVKSTRGNRIVFDVDHIKPWSRFPDLRFELSNGRTLCRPCHMKTDTWLGKARWEKFTGKKAELLA